MLLRQQIDKNRAKKKQYTTELKTAVDQFQNAAKNRLANSVKLKSQVAKCLLMIADIATRQPVDLQRAQQYLAAAQPLIQQLPADQSVVAQYHYRVLLLARAEKNDPLMQEHADWLVPHARGRSYEMTGLIIKAVAIDKQLPAVTQPSKQLLQTGLDIYQRLVGHLGANSTTVKQSKNAKVACSKLAYFSSRTGNHAQAAQSLAVLLSAFPNQRDYLQRAGRAEFEIQNYETSLNRWRKLLLGLPRNSVAWFEAKQYQIACLEKTDPEMARKVLDQFKLLHSNWGKPPWQDKMKEIDRRLPPS